MPHKLLIVEDEAIIALDLACKVSRLGYEVVNTTGLGEEAVALARDLQPDAVLMDMQLAGAMDGIAAAEGVRKVSNAAIIFLTAHSEPAVIERAKQAAPAGYIAKPFDISDLEAALRRGLAEQPSRASRQDTEEVSKSLPDACGRAQSTHP